MLKLELRGREIKGIANIRIYIKYHVDLHV